MMLVVCIDMLLMEIDFCGLLFIHIKIYFFPLVLDVSPTVHIFMPYNSDIYVCMWACVCVYADLYHFLTRNHSGVVSNNK